MHEISLLTTPTTPNTLLLTNSTCNLSWFSVQNDLRVLHHGIYWRSTTEVVSVHLESEIME